MSPPAEAVPTALGDSAVLRFDAAPPFSAVPVAERRPPRAPCVTASSGTGSSPPPTSPSAPATASSVSPGSRMCSSPARPHLGRPHGPLSPGHRAGRRRRDHSVEGRPPWRERARRRRPRPPVPRAHPAPPPSARHAIEEPLLPRLGHRLPWLLLGLGGAVAAAIVSAFERDLERCVLLAFFVPRHRLHWPTPSAPDRGPCHPGLSVGVDVGRIVRRELLNGPLAASP